MVLRLKGRAAGYGAPAYGAPTAAPGGFAAPGRFAGAAVCHRGTVAGVGAPVLAGPSPWSLVSLGLVGHAQIQADSGTIISLMGSAASNIPPAVTSSLQFAGTMFAALTVLWAAAIVPGPVSMCALVLE